MEQIFEHYNKWEDYHAGLYSLNDVRDKHKKVFGCIELLQNDQYFYAACEKIMKEWPVSSGVNLSNRSQNRRAWLGAAACLLIHQAPEYLTRIAWGLLNKEEQNSANLVADKIIRKYERENSKVHKNLGEPMLF